MVKKILNFFQILLKSMFFDEQRKIFSRTAFMNFIFFLLTVVTWIILLIILVLNYQKEDKIDSVYVGVITGYATFITGGGFLHLLIKN